ncbi:unnamed protein product [Brachionus calyciflorus]|uniref:Uncharacterized protein n=1 Tax=Brachionus calyciflorus TaxID=104777 RepID=A0A814N9A0_9BILA|nr:unnamed protein product [Brachionus calyciflorus]
MQHQNLRTGFSACSILHTSHVKIDLTRGSCAKPTSLVFGGASFIGISDFMQHQSLTRNQSWEVCRIEHALNPVLKF